MPPPALLLFAKSPRPGRVKTRLCPPLPPAAAAALAAWMIRYTVDLARAHWPGPVSLWAWPDTRHPLWRALEARGLPVLRQGPGDLGEKMAAALAWGIRRQGAAAVMGCDLPHCPPRVLRDAARALAGGREVIGPAADGGYYLIGLTRARRGPFRGMPWGGRRLFPRTLGRLGAGGRRPRVLPVLRDLDRWEDVAALAARWPPLAEALARAGAPAPAAQD